MNTDKSSILDEALCVIEALRSEGCHVHSITNTVAQNFGANVLLACGATVSMADNPREIDNFLEFADCLHVNLGTLNDAQLEAVKKALSFARGKKLPVTLDPVMAEMSPLRMKLTNEIIRDVDIIKLNGTESKVFEKLDRAKTCIVTTGQIDKIEYKEQQITLENGGPLMASTIATGCAIGGLISALSAKTDNPVIASLAGLVWFSVAGEIAAEKCEGPGSFSPAFLDALYLVDTDTLKQKANLAI